MGTPKERAAAISSLTAYRQKLEADLAALKQEIETIDRTLAVMRGQSPAARKDTAPTLQSEIEGFLKSHPGKWFTTTEVITLLQQAGLDIESRSRRSTVAAGLKRLEDKPGFQVERKEGSTKRFKFRYVGSDEGSDTADGDDGNRAESGSLL